MEGHAVTIQESPPSLTTSTFPVQFAMRGQHPEVLTMIFRHRHSTATERACTAAACWSFGRHSLHLCHSFHLSIAPLIPSIPLAHPSLHAAFRTFYPPKAIENVSIRGYHYFNHTSIGITSLLLSSPSSKGPSENFTHPFPRLIPVSYLSIHSAIF
jgi:hypothetical protein